MKGDYIMKAKEAIEYLKLDIAMTKFDCNTGEEKHLYGEEAKVLEAEELALKCLQICYQAKVIY